MKSLNDSTATWCVAAVAIVSVRSVFTDMNANRSRVSGYAGVFGLVEESVSPVHRRLHDAAAAARR